ncbi:hypothetical protein NPIL_697711 [Nephila pilipes]|uniref:Uncharacterized protein n=1 Tax=Nephila pilipes TaxID=299642 RepID=A0A8X6IX53_NEPPI|nr:hypothetical protein NPIL_697711 [Nephila pilipes]
MKKEQRGSGQKGGGRRPFPVMAPTHHLSCWPCFNVAENKGYRGSVRLLDRLSIHNITSIDPAQNKDTSTFRKLPRTDLRSKSLPKMLRTPNPSCPLAAIDLVSGGTHIRNLVPPGLAISVDVRELGYR